jgi:plastocyanin
MIPIRKLMVFAIVVGLALSESGAVIHPTNGATISVNIQSFAFNPQNVAVNTGDSVIWTNNDPVIYTLWFTNASDGSTYLLSPPINPGTTWVHTFSDKIQLNYYDFDRLSITGQLTVQPFDFALSNSGGITVMQGGSASTTIAASLVSGNTEPVTLSTIGLPAVSAVFSDRSCPSAPSCTTSPNFSVILVISTQPSVPGTPVGSYTITVAGTGGGVTHTTQFILTVNPGTIGGVVVPVDKLAMLMPYLGLASLIGGTMALIAVYVGRSKQRENRSE